MLESSNHQTIVKKAGLDLISSNYRLASNLVFLSKVLERVVLEQFTTYCDTHKLIPDYQSAYRKHFSCETSIIKVVNDTLWNFENQEVCAMCMIDLCTAFDMVDCHILLQVLQSRFGVSEQLQWLGLTLIFMTKVLQSQCGNKVLHKQTPRLFCSTRQPNRPKHVFGLCLYPARNCS